MQFLQKNTDVQIYEHGANNERKLQENPNISQDVSKSEESTENISPLNLQMHFPSPMENEHSSSSIQSRLDEEYPLFLTQKSKVYKLVIISLILISYAFGLWMVDSLGKPRPFGWPVCTF